MNLNAVAMDLGATGTASSLRDRLAEVRSERPGTALQRSSTGQSSTATSGDKPFTGVRNRVRAMGANRLLGNSDRSAPFAVVNPLCASAAEFGGVRHAPKADSDGPLQAATPLNVDNGANHSVRRKRSHRSERLMNADSDVAMALSATGSGRRRSTLWFIASAYTRRLSHLAQSHLHALMYTGVVNYNHLESAFLVSAVLIMMLGMVFSSKGIDPSSGLYALLAGITATIIVVAISSFVCLMVFEVFRSLKFIALNDIARKVEVERAEQAMLERRRGGKKPARRTSLMAVIRHVSMRWTLGHDELKSQH